MKKTLVTLLALVFVLSIASAALAAPANPFVDVPAKHWAYGAVSKLAKAGVVDGYGDGTFRGDRTMTRYEMAQIVAKAMAKSEKADAEMKALIDKLAVEFAAELNNLGVRVAKLEAKQNVSWTFESRVRYADNDSNAKDAVGGFDWRQRIYLSGKVNDMVSYGARLEAGNVAWGTQGNQTVGFNRAFFNVKDFLGTFDMVTVGRFGTSGWTPGLLQSRTSNNDGLTFTEKFGDANFRAALLNVGGNSETQFYSLSSKVADNLTLGVAYQISNLKGGDANLKWPTAVWTGTIYTKSTDFWAVAKMGDFKLVGEYVSTKDVTSSNATRKAYALSFHNGIPGVFYPVMNIVDPMKAHTDAFSVSYRNIDHNAVPVFSGFNGNSNAIRSSGNFSYDNDIKALYFAYQNVVSKGVIWSVEYTDAKKKSDTTVTDKFWNTSFQFFF